MLPWILLAMASVVGCGAAFLFGWIRGHAAGVEAGTRFEQRKGRPAGNYTQAPHGFPSHDCTPSCPQLPKQRR